MELESFKLSALEALSKIIGSHFTGTEISELFRKAGFHSQARPGQPVCSLLNLAIFAIQIFAQNAFLIF